MNVVNIIHAKHHVVSMLKLAFTSKYCCTSVRKCSPIELPALVLFKKNAKCVGSTFTNMWTCCFFFKLCIIINSFSVLFSVQCMVPADPCDSYGAALPNRVVQQCTAVCHIFTITFTTDFSVWSSSFYSIFASLYTCSYASADISQLLLYYWHTSLIYCWVRFNIHLTAGI